MGFNPNFVPHDSFDSGRPISSSNIKRLAITQTPGGKGVLAWCRVTGEKNKVFVAIVDSPAQFSESGTVGPEEWREALTFYDDGFPFDGAAHFGSMNVMCIGDELLLLTLHWAADLEHPEDRELGLRIIAVSVANDPEDPTDWSLRGVVEMSALGAQSNYDVMPGKIYRMASGRWVLMQASIQHSQEHLTRSDHRYDVYYSDDNGATWVWALYELFENAIGRFPTHFANQIELDPISNKLFFCNAGYDGGGGMWTSTDGANWTMRPLDVVPESGNRDDAMVPFVNDGVNAYMVWHDGHVYRLDDIDIAAFDGSGVTEVGTWTQSFAGDAFGAIVTVNGTTFVVKQRIQQVAPLIIQLGPYPVDVPGGGWVVGCIAWSPYELTDV